MSKKRSVLLICETIEDANKIREEVTLEIKKKRLEYLTTGEEIYDDKIGC